ncbi:unnamed protein product [Albugo candida]|uniref:Uncharacterized protein n=1 Tax=Albugo candida TaxID=65357 RepID=A0A024GVQ3_9STRA|nr:unnamed protein product [Albugo candida]CCI50455.1 unnamed protein product [Albugo candida]|eukprot:CCI48222.1 unnamed protein product [Albugo candida]
MSSSKATGCSPIVSYSIKGPDTTQGQKEVIPLTSNIIIYVSDLSDRFTLKIVNALGSAQSDNAQDIASKFLGSHLPFKYSKLVEEIQPKGCRDSTTMHIHGVTFEKNKREKLTDQKRIVQ